MPAPACRVVAVAVASHCCPIEDALDAATHPARSLRPLFPGRLYRFHHEPEIDRLYWQIAEMRIGIVLKRARPLRGVFLASPAGAVRGDIGLGAFLERHRVGGFELCGGALRSAVLDRVDAVEPQLAALPR